MPGGGRPNRWYPGTIVLSYECLMVAILRALTRATTHRAVKAGCQCKEMLLPTRWVRVQARVH
jgi:hypothetical protein